MGVEAVYLAVDGDENKHEVVVCNVEETNDGELCYMVEAEGFYDPVEGVPIAIIDEGKRRPIKAILDVDQTRRQVDTDFEWVVFMHVITVRN